jgi:hypothetical protein
LPDPDNAIPLAAIAPPMPLNCGAPDRKPRATIGPLSVVASLTSA